MEELSKSIDRELHTGASPSIVNIIDLLIKHAFHVNASDIHIDPFGKSVRVKFRIDGVLGDDVTLPKHIHGEIIARVKVLARLRTDEHQTAQDGRFRYILADRSIDFRVSIVPTYHGENAVLRLLSDRGENLNLENLGFTERDQKKILTALKKPNGMILVTGPTGSGKTTTLYTLIKLLNTPLVSIVTIEDPIEYSIPHIKQIQVNPRHGLTFANGLRSILRQDPDIVMVGEIRDKETGHIAVHTALTGHLLLSTLHTNDAATALPRLFDMGIEEYLAAATISLIIGQRLVRKICSACKEEYVISANLLKSLEDTPFKKLVKKDQIVYRGIGCALCSQSGYQGRTSISEVLVADKAMQDTIFRAASADTIKTLATKNGMTTMLEDGLRKIKAGITTIEELLRVIHD